MSSKMLPFWTVILVSLVLEGGLIASVTSDAKILAAQGQWGKAEAQIHAAGNTPDAIEAVSWLGRGALGQNDLDRAAKYADQAYQLAVAELRRRRLDAEPQLPLGLGAAIEVKAQVLARRGERGEAVTYLQGELKKFAATSIRTRIQKNVLLLSLEGKPAPALDVTRWLGPKPPPLPMLKGKPVLLFFWAHWCGDCKGEVASLARLSAEFSSSGLTLIGPTQHYGYVAAGEDAPPQKETAYIDEVRKQYYGSLANMPVPLSEENFKNFGSSTSPTLVLIDRKGIVRMYHPGAMSYEELRSRILPVL
jgi:thiol-disulfide isomerase/thioredoxin